MWHVMVYSRGFKSTYHHPYAVHLFTPESLSPGEAFKIAEELLVKAFPEWVKLGEKLVYVGYEQLPIELPQDSVFYVAVKLEYAGFGRFEVASTASTVPQQLASSVEDYRRRFITLDYDHDIDETKVLLLDALGYLKEAGYSNVRVFKTYRGYHVRAELPSPMSLDKILETRSKLGDDYSRRRIDVAYTNSGLGFLTNLLFNSKCWIEGNEIKCYEEREVDVANISATRTVYMSVSLPPLTITTSKGTVEVSGKTLKLVGRFSSKDAERIKTSVEDNFWEYAYAYTQQADVKKRLADAYGKISSALARVIEKCDVRVESGVAVIHVPESLQQYVGRLIGKQGQNIRAVEAELGVRVRIERTSPPPEDVEMKKKLQELLRRVV